MMLYLQDLAKQGEQTRDLILTDRLPSFLAAPCALNVTYRIEAEADFYLIHLTVSGSINMICQRCMHEFNYPYHNQTKIGVCSSEERAETLVEHYECIVSSTGNVILEDLIIDELHLYLPQAHPNETDCNEDIIQMLQQID